MGTPIETRNHFYARSGASRPWVVGGMAYGISSVQLVDQASRAGCLAFFGTGGLSIERIAQVARVLDPIDSVGFNVPYLPHPTHDHEVFEVLRRAGHHRVEVSGRVRPTADVVAFRYAGLREADAPRFVLAKISRMRCAEAWLQPPSRRVLREAVRHGWLTEAEAERAARAPATDALVLEGDSGGHTDRRSWFTLLPAVQDLRGELDIALGVAGGIGTPEACAAALALGADFAMGGSVHQSCDEAGVVPEVRQWLRQAGVEDFAYAPSPVRFGTPARVQVLARPTPFAERANRVERIYRDSQGRGLSFDEQAFLEERLQLPLPEAWADTVAYLSERDPGLLERVQTERDQLALLCRAWLARCARRAVEADGGEDIQVWAGPAVAALNARAKGSSLAERRPVSELVEFLCPQA